MTRSEQDFLIELAVSSNGRIRHLHPRSRSLFHGLRELQDSIHQQELKLESSRRCPGRTPARFLQSEG